MRIVALIAVVGLLCILGFAVVVTMLRRPLIPACCCYAYGMFAPVNSPA